jgi:hypothetical protein
LSQLLPLTKGGDYDDNDIVDGEDYRAWRAAFGGNTAPFGMRTAAGMERWMPRITRFGDFKSV